MHITGPGDYRYEGADLGILITRGRVMDDKFELNERALNWIRGVKRLYAAKPLTEMQRDEAPSAASFKILYLLALSAFSLRSKNQVKRPASDGSHI